MELKICKMKLAQLEDHCKIWIYQADKELNNDELKVVEEKSELFLSNWSSHGSDLKAAIEVFYNRFIVIAVDEKVAQATGCSIDKSVHFIKELGYNTNIDFFNRLIITYKVGDSIKSLPMAEFGQKLSDKQLSEETIVFNNLVETLGDFRKNWETSVRNSWHKQLL